MANVTKFTRAASSHMFGHFQRAKNASGVYIQFSNIEIDPHRTPLNYNLAPQHDQKQGDFLRQRCSEVKCLNRKDVNVMCSWIVTIPKSMAGTPHQEEFFEQTYCFLEERYGRDNVVSAYVHLDEVTPHMHFAFCPVVRDQKKGHWKVSAKECISRMELKRFHPELDDHLRKTMRARYTGGILNEATKDGNKSIEELKRQSASERLSQAHSDVENILSDGQRRIDEMHIQIQDLEETLQGKQLSIAEIESLQPRRDMLGAIRGITLLDVENLKKSALASYEWQHRYEQLQTDYKKLEAKIPSIKEQIKMAKDKKRLETFEEIIQRLPENVRKTLLLPEQKKGQNR